jgi:hypothetical protein
MQFYNTVQTQHSINVVYAKRWWTPGVRHNDPLTFCRYDLFSCQVNSCDDYKDLHQRERPLDLIWVPSEITKIRIKNRYFSTRGRKYGHFKIYSFRYTSILSWMFIYPQITEHNRLFFTGMFSKPNLTPFACPRVVLAPTKGQLLKTDKRLNENVRVWEPCWNS